MAAKPRDPGILGNGTAHNRKPIKTTMRKLGRRRNRRTYNQVMKYLTKGEWRNW